MQKYGLNILFVEDDLIDQKSFERYVSKEKRDYQYKIAATLDEAIELIQSFKFDLVLADITLPDGTAFDLLKHIPDFVPVIFITGSSNQKVILKAFRLGVEDYLIKEINGEHLKQLPECITRLINKQKAFDHRIEESIAFHKSSLIKHGIEVTPKASQKALEALVFKTHIGVVITDADAYILRVNKGFTDITGYSGPEVIGKNMNILKSGKQDKVFYRQFWKQLIETGTYQGSLWNRAKDHVLYRQLATITAIQDDDEVTKYVAILSNITEQYNKDQQMQQLAFYDALTNLANRRLLLDRIKQELAISKRTGLYGSVIYLDIDNFKLLNDSSGHHIGDQLLIQLAQRLNAALREEDTASRLGGDEFVVLIHATQLSKDKATKEAQVVANKIKLALNQPYHLDDGIHSLSPSIGIALFPNNGSIAEEILHHADQAMYSSKNTGGNNIRLFQADNEAKKDEIIFRVCLIEDSITDTLLTLETLKEFSFVTGLALDIKTCSDGESGLSYLDETDSKENMPDLILLDLNLPEINGYEVLKQVKSNPVTRHIPIVVFTVTTEYTIIDKCLKLQANDFIQKPLTVEGFKQTLRNCGMGALLINSGN